MASNAGIAGSGLAAAVALSEVSAGIVVGAAAAFLHYSYLKGDLLQMEDAQVRREMEIKELAAKTSETSGGFKKAIFGQELHCKSFPQAQVVFSLSTADYA